MEKARCDNEPFLFFCLPDSFVKQVAFGLDGCLTA